LTIPAGTVFYGSRATFSAFIQLPKSQVFAKGTATAPVIFTSAKATRARGDWGGIVIAGRAPIAGAVQGTSGLNTSKTLMSYMEGLDVRKPYLAGGTNDNDNSGSYTFVQCNYAGLNVGASGSGNELNSFSLYGVGKATKMSNIQVAYANDDAIEWFGGSVNMSNIFILNTLDDDLDIDCGYQGTIQNVLVYRLDTASRDISRSRLAEITNKNPHHARKTMPVISNVTAFGARAIVGKTYVFKGSSSNERSMTGFSIATNAAPRIYNSIIHGYDQAIHIEDSLTANNLDSSWGAQFKYNAWNYCVNDMTVGSTIGTWFASKRAFPYDNKDNWVRYFQTSNFKGASDNIKNIGYNVTVGQGVYPTIANMGIYATHKADYGNLANALIKFGSGFGSEDTLNVRVTSKALVSMLNRGVANTKLTGFSTATDEDNCGAGLPFGGNNASDNSSNGAEMAAASLQLSAINPSEGAINVAIEDAKNNQISDVKVFDMAGKLVKSSVATGKNINISGMPVGLYTVVVSSNNNQESIKVFVK
jgi:hypothetical protein